MSDAEIMHPEHFDVIAEDPSHAFAADMGLELLKFCITKLENEFADNNQEMEDLNEEELQVSCFLLRTSQNLPLHWVQLAEWETDHHVEEDPYNLADSEAAEDYLPEIEAACELFVNDGTKGSELDGGRVPRVSWGVQGMWYECKSDVCVQVGISIYLGKSLKSPKWLLLQVAQPQRQLIREH
jgi:hypothetical protein